MDAESKRNSRMHSIPVTLVQDLFLMSLNYYLSEEH